MTITTSGQAADVENAVGKILDDHADFSAARSSVMGDDRDFHADLWRELASTFGMCAMHAPEELGGAGDVALAAAATRALGARLSSLPYLPTVALASMPLITVERTGAGDELLGAISAGEATASAVLDASLTVVDGHVDGRAERVLHGGSVDWILVADGARLWGISAAELQATRRPQSIDLTRPLATLEARGAVAHLLGSADRAVLPLQRTFLMALTAHESAAAAEQASAMAVSYARVREQFGRAIGSYQAIKHLCAELAIDAESAAAAAWAATEQLGGPEEQTAALAGYLYTTQAFVRVATQSLHVHGGIGFTWEFDSHLYYRRAYANTVLLGRLSELKSEHGRALLAQHAGLASDVRG